ncbi:MAG: twin-arginine translocation signal domain-containing protein, partial [Flavobacterium sp.]
MTNRRNFLKKTAMASAAVAFGSFAGRAGELEEQNELLDGKVRKPIVLSTWRFGLQANEAAWEVLKKGGRALDAVEAGVKVPEADPKERSVGYGGRPDRQQCAGPLPARLPPVGRGVVRPRFAEGAPKAAQRAAIAAGG